MSQETREQVALAVKAVESKKGENVVILEMDRAAGAFTDYFVICTGTNPRQIQAISDEVERLVSQAGGRPNSVEGHNQAEWVLLDYVHFVVHVFSERSRSFYDLERLWKSAKRLSSGDLLKKRAASPGKKGAKKTARAASRKTAAKPVRSKGAAKKKARKRS
jgi:ribosome-associated protein